MTSRSLTLLAAILMLAFLSGCGTDTKTANDLGGSNFTANHLDSTATPNIIEGYVIKKDSNGELLCGDCHKPDQTDVTINRQWADSAHAGHILTAGSVQDTSAWAHYDWDKTNDTVAGDCTGRAACQRCHTTTGVSNFLDAPATYNPANNDFLHLSGWTATTGSPQQELLYCWSCHSDAATGAMRNPGSLTINYSNGASATYPDVAASNVCVACHTGAEIGDSIKGSTGDFTNLSFINSHYLTAGGQVFAVNGYEYAGQSYNIGYHQKIGVANVWNTGNDGPCVGCHMSGDKPHTWDFLTKDGSGTITTNQSTLCSKCHAAMSPATLEAEKERFAKALEALNLALQAKGLFFSNSYPDYFFKSATDYSSANAFKNWDGVNVGTVAVPITGKGKDVMGAAFNYNLIEHDPGAFAHNNAYALKLIADSIDFLNDGLVDGDLNVASELLGKGINIGSEAGYAMVHNFTVASETTCSACHSSAPHYGGSAVYSTGGTWSGTAWSGTTNVLGKGQYLFVGVTCSECHAGTMANASILPQYSESGHGNVMGDGWIHYNWKWTVASATLVGSSDRSGCARCHTSTGYKAAILNPNSPTPPFASNNGDAGNPAEVLSCGACHADVSTGVLRNPGAVTPKSIVNPPAILVKKTLPTDAATTIANLPDAGKSNGCNYCHVGGGNMFSTWSSSRIASHHAVAAGVLYGTTTRIGYEFVDAAGTAYLDYTIPASFTSPKHADIGSVDGKGPCASCHMPSLDHHFAVVDERTRTITAQAVCNTCHTVGSADEMTYAKIEEEKEGYINAGTLLSAYIANTITNYKEAAVTGSVTAENDRAAWYNSQLFPAAEAGAFAHNRFYVKRLIFDSIDWLDNGVMDGQITIGAVYPEARIWLTADLVTGIATRL